MGYEWNKYNQTHYDHDNPPPKVVQGFKFNIFYPDLVDNTKAPTYRIERENGRKRGELSAPAGEDDTCVIRFTAGPPYEDIAFRIVDKEWDYSAKRERGFRSRFDKVRCAAATVPFSIELDVMASQTEVTRSLVVWTMRFGATIASDGQANCRAGHSSTLLPVQKGECSLCVPGAQVLTPFANYVISDLLSKIDRQAQFPAVSRWFASPRNA